MSQGTQEVQELIAEQPVMVALADILPNPFQPREAEDPAVVAEIAASIYYEGLMQIPSARHFDGHYELVFGHTRKAAYELLATKGIPDLEIPAHPAFAFMPLYVRELDARKMFEMAIAENIKRRNLNPIEQARSMQLYMDQFEASSAQTGQLFGVGDSTVRGMVRLLKLSKRAQALVAAGEINLATARRLVSIAQIDESTANAAAEAIVEGRSPENALLNALNNNKNVVTMWEGWRGDDPRGGPGLWPLDMQSVKFPDFDPVTSRDVFKAVQFEATAGRKKDVNLYLAQLTSGLVGEWANTAFDEEARRRIDILWNPPACTACPLHLVNGKAHLCGMKVCHQRKTAAWLREEARKLSKKMAIAVFDPERDGKDRVTLAQGSWGDEYKADNKLVEAKDPSLRLEIHPGNNGAHLWTKHPWVRVIAVGKKAVQKLRAEEARKSKDSEDDWQKQYQRQQALRSASRSFLVEYASTLFAEAFAGLSNPFAAAALINVTPKKGAKKNEMLVELRRSLAERALHNIDYPGGAVKGPVAIAKHLEKVAITWGVKLPADFRDVAKKYQPVSAETARPKGV